MLKCLQGQLVTNAIGVDEKSMSVILNHPVTAGQTRHATPAQATSIPKDVVLPARAPLNQVHG